MSDELTIRQERFCVEYVRTGSAREAYKAAGYVCKSNQIVDSNATRLLRYDKIKRRIRELSDSIASPKIADAKEMQEILTQIIRKKSQDVFAGITRDGTPISFEHDVGIREIISAIDKLARMQGAYLDRVQLSGAAEEKSKLDAILAQLRGPDEQ